MFRIYKVLAAAGGPFGPSVQRLSFATAEKTIFYYLMTYGDRKRRVLRFIYFSFNQKSVNHETIFNDGEYGVDYLQEVFFGWRCQLMGVP